MDIWKMFLPPGVPGAQVPGFGTLPTPLDNSMGIQASQPFSLPGSSGGGPMGFGSQFGGMGRQMDMFNLAKMLMGGR